MVWGRDVRGSDRIPGTILYAVSAFVGEFCIAVLIARADHG
jgi:hypothetical protein